MSNKNKTCLRTMKIKYCCSEEAKKTILDIQKNYNSLLRCTYNYLFDNTTVEKITKKDFHGNDETTLNIETKNDSTSEITEFQHKLNNIFVDSHFKNSAIYEAKALIAKNGKDHILFGGKALQKRYLSGLITKEEYNLQRLVPICSIGEGLKNGNRKFTIITDTEILFKPGRDTHITLVLNNISDNYRFNLIKLIECQYLCNIPITYKLDSEYIYISYDYKIINQMYSNKNYNINHVDNRIFAIDMNPNYIGYSIVDWKDSENFKVLNTGVFSLKSLNDYDNSLKNFGKFSSDSIERKQIKNKRHFETINIAKKLINLTVSYNCEIFSLEDLKINSQDLGKGKRLNRLCNNLWNRDLLVQVLEKNCILYDIKFQKVKPDYSSFIGNLIYRNIKCPDMCLASIEISRRAYEFHHQYILKDKKKEKTVVFPRITSRIASKIQSGMTLLGFDPNHSLEEMSLEKGLNFWKSVYKKLKEEKLLQKERVQIETITPLFVFSKNHKKNFQILYRFI